LDISNRRKDEAFGIMAELRENLKKLEKSFRKTKQHNIELRECIILYERRFENIILQEVENHNLQFSGDAQQDR
jgi:hypothetical protein